MDVAMIGLGRMGGNMARRLLRGGHRVVVWNRTFAKAQELQSEGAEAVERLRDVPATLPTPRVLWLMLPQGEATQQAIDALRPLLAGGDILIDGGNSFYKEDIVRAEALSADGIRYLDAGTSGGVWGLEAGYCLMGGGERSAFDHVSPLLATLAPSGHGFDYMGGAGSGHFVKMVHNGIEYGMMQAYAEGFEILGASPWELDMAAIADLWDHSSVVRSWLLELAADAFRKDPKLEQIRGWVDDTGEGRWTVQQAIESAVPAPVIASSLFMRFRSRQDDSFAARVLAALRVRRPC
jgi:6-phosphogluconate dehydrogenase